MNNYCKTNALIKNKQIFIKNKIYLLEIELPDKYNTEYGIKKIKQINNTFSKMIKCADVKIYRTKQQDYIKINYEKGEQNV